MDIKLIDKLKELLVKLMSEEEINKLRTRLQLVEDSNRILVQKLKDKEKDMKLINNLYLKEKEKINKIYNVVSSNKITEENYLKMVEWIKSVIKEETK